jgi:hypothetical protein
MIDDISLTLFLCGRSEVAPAVSITTRRFVAGCGEKLVATISDNKVMTIQPDDNWHDFRGCRDCKEKVTFIKKLVASGK